ncbi:uncharacterized protein C7orf57 homolog isoform X2 [Clupea harengus]|uniref:Uncharacterized protein C7orf57 homolog isoform X2 n=1 Tax=Clupea harengus TaxID=7950 RepID=A0A6P8EDI1_CLUHA|nr:uncharacterized protein C7orf57 homolog isoform X2 [Clupea harengus]
MGDGRKDDASSQGSKVSSQIPGLSLDFQDNVEGNATGRRLGVVDTDSNYVKLAKQGGHKGLLWHEETNMPTKTNSAYKPPDWFCADSEAPSLTKRTDPGFLVHEEFQKSARKFIQPPGLPFGSDNKSAWEREADSIATKEFIQPTGPPFGSDNKSTWEREADIIAAKEKIIQPTGPPFGSDNKSTWEREADIIAAKETLGIDNSANQLKKLTMPQRVCQEDQFRKYIKNKDESPVNMSKLLSFGYLEEDKNPRRTPAHAGATSALAGGAVRLKLPQ